MNSVNSNRLCVVFVEFNKTAKNVIKLTYKYINHKSLKKGETVLNLEAKKGINIHLLFLDLKKRHFAILFLNGKHKEAQSYQHWKQALLLCFTSANTIFFSLRSSVCSFTHYVKHMACFDLIYQVFITN